MFTNEEARSLIDLPKVLEDPNYTIHLGTVKNRVHLLDEDEKHHKFFLDITTNRKIQFKISLHHQETLLNIGLLRIDFNGRHQNPIGHDENLPHEFLAYVGKFFEKDEPHIHYYVEGYRPLVWVLPLTDIKFTPQIIQSMNDFEQAIRQTGKLINVVSSLNIQQALI